MRRALVLAALALACGGGSGDSGGGGTASPGPGDAPAQPEPPQPPPDEPSIAGPCHVEDELAPAAAASECPAPTALGAPVETRIPRYGTSGCGDDVKVDGAGTLAAYATEALGGGGYWSGELAFARRDGTLVRPPFRAMHRASAAGAEGLLAFLDPWDATAYGAGGEPVTTARVEWPMQLGQWFWPAAYLGFMAAAGDGEGGLVVALAGVGTDASLELWAARIGAAARIETEPFRVVTAPAPEPDFATDRYAGAARRALGTVVLGRDGAGRILVLWDGEAACGEDTIAGRWFSPDGSALGPVFRAATGIEARDPIYQGRLRHRLVRLLDGSLALQHHDGRWLRRFASGKPAAGPVPDWLARRGGETLAATPGGRVLAAIRPAAAREDRRPAIALLSASGEVCAEHVLPAQPTPTEEAPDVVEVGFDGTVVVSAGVECDPAFDPTWCTHLLCVYRSWPAALR